ncbi:exported hypothetical protein [Capnocytophaga canimorsus]|nr:hypothetical protein [Capnocytophaga canimorsus]CEN49577.1 exported hypothetical protein [Capnocytophaga canimorsus]
MYRHNKHIVSLLLWLCLWLSGLWGNLLAQNKVWVGQTTTLSVSDVPNNTYTWELYVPTPNVDFLAKISGQIVRPRKAVFYRGEIPVRKCKYNGLKQVHTIIRSV